MDSEPVLQNIIYPRVSTIEQYEYCIRGKSLC